MTYNILITLVKLSCYRDIVKPSPDISRYNHFNRRNFSHHCSCREEPGAFYEFPADLPALS